MKDFAVFLVDNVKYMTVGTAPRKGIVSIYVGMILVQSYNYLTVFPKYHGADE